MMRKAWIWILVAWAASLASSPTLGSDTLLLPEVSTAPPAEADVARDVLQAAFANRYEVDLTTQIDLVVHSRSGQQAQAHPQCRHQSHR